jgi:hypothetical protein
MNRVFRISNWKSRSLAGSTVAFLGVAFVALGLLSGCNNDDPVVVDLPPSAPDGVYSVTGDGQVTICWNKNPENDIAGYDIYWNDQPSGAFQFVASVGPNTTCYTDTDVTNGTTYFYAVLAFDREGQESQLSIEDVFDTPRPEGTNLVMFDYLGQNSGLSGYDFSALTGTAQAWNAAGTDVFFGTPNGEPTLFAAGAAVDVQDYGYIDLVYVDWAPSAGWSGVGAVELIQGHSYIIRITNQSGRWNVAKVYVVDLTPGSVTLDWAYQIDQNNFELAPGIGGAQR